MEKANALETPLAAAKKEKTAMTDKTQTPRTDAPEKIYLQYDSDDCTWCRDQVNDDDVPYVRADLLAAANARLEGIVPCGRCGCDIIASAVAEKVDADGKSCPSCGSTNPKHHPGTSAGGEVSLCHNPWHKPTAAQIRAAEKVNAEEVEGNRAQNGLVDVAPSDPHSSAPVPQPAAAAKEPRK